MAKIVYTKKNEFRLFDLKVFEFNTFYNERSNENDTDENDFYIELREVENEQR